MIADRAGDATNSPSQGSYGQQRTSPLTGNPLAKSLNSLDSMNANALFEGVASGSPKRTDSRGNLALTGARDAWELADDTMGASRATSALPPGFNHDGQKPSIEQSLTYITNKLKEKQRAGGRPWDLQVQFTYF